MIFQSVVLRVIDLNQFSAILPSETRKMGLNLLFDI